MKKHVEYVHEGKRKQFKCSCCDEIFKVNDQLIKHIAFVHEGKKPYECKICHARFSFKSLLAKHKATPHDKFGKKYDMKEIIENNHEGKK